MNTSVTIICSKDASENDVKVAIRKKLNQERKYKHTKGFTFSYSLHFKKSLNDNMEERTYTVFIPSRFEVYKP